MKARIRVISLLLSILMLVTLFAGCGEKKTGSEDAQNVKSGTEVNKEPIVFKYWMRGPGKSAPIKSMSENMVYQELEKRTGVKIEFIHPAYGQEQEQFQLMIASDDLPDIIQNYGRSYPGGADKAIKDGVFLKLNDLIDKYAPNFNKVRETIPLADKVTITDEGNIWSFPAIKTTEEPPYTGLIVRQDWLDELGIKAPTTISEFHDMLVAFKEKKNATAPFQFRLSDWTLAETGCIVSAFGTGSSFFLKDGQMKYGPIEPGYKEFLTLLSDWYKEGLIYKDFETLTNFDQFKQMLATDKVGAFIYCYSIIDDMEKSQKDANPNTTFKLRALPYPTLNPGERVHYRQTLTCMGYNEAVITTSCKNPEEAVKWFDYHYSQEGFMLFNYGVEGISYKMVDGKPQFIGELLKDYWTLENKYKIDQGPALRDWAAIPPFSEGIKHAMDTWSQADTDMYVPDINRTADEETKYSAIMNEIQTYVNEMNVKFVMGIEPISKYDDFVKKIKDMKIDEVLAIQQAAYERYLKR